MKRLFFLLSIGVLPLASQACDICGLFMGVMAYDTQPSVSVFHRYRSFNGYSALGQSAYLFPTGASWLGSGWGREGAQGGLPGSGVGHTHGSSEYDYEIFRVMELRARVFLTKRVETTLILPWVNNESRIDGRTVTTNGFGDATLLVGYHVLTPRDSARVQQRLVVGGGIKFPTGNYYAQDSEGTRVDNLLQPGTGMTDYLAYAAYTANYKRWIGGLTAQAKTSTENYYRESYAPGYTGNLFFGRQFKLGTAWLFVPQVQAYYEYTEGERIQQELLNEHQMNTLLGGVGVDILYKGVQLTASVQVPVAERATDHLQQAGRVTLGLTWNLRGFGPLFRK